MWFDYLGLWILFLFFLGLTIAIYYYARWQIKGPVFKMKWKKFKSWILREDRGQVKVKKGSAIIDDRVLEEIEKTKTSAEAAQEHLQAQKLEFELEREKEKALQEYEEKAKSKKLFKSKSKEELAKEDKVVSGTSILDELGSGDSAQDLLHRQDDVEIVEIEPESEGESIIDSMEENKEN